MSRLHTLVKIIEEIEVIQEGATCPIMKAVTAEQLVRWNKELHKERKKNALDVIEYKLRHLTSKLK